MHCGPESCGIEVAVANRSVDRLALDLVGHQRARGFGILHSSSPRWFLNTESTGPSTGEVTDLSTDTRSPGIPSRPTEPSPPVSSRVTTSFLEHVNPGLPLDIATRGRGGPRPTLAGHRRTVTQVRLAPPGRSTRSRPTSVLPPRRTHTRVTTDMPIRRRPKTEPRTKPSYQPNL
jgi:hypothetical protein